jgi:hypothetical protein
VSDDGKWCELQLQLMVRSTHFWKISLRQDFYLFVRKQNLINDIESLCDMLFIYVNAQTKNLN